MYFPISGPDGVDVLPTHENGEEAVWAMGRDGIQKHVDAGTLIWKQRQRSGAAVWEPYTREFAPANPTRPWPTIWNDLPTMRQAKAFLRDVFHTTDVFSTPKPVELIERVLRVMGGKDDIVLDFFAGSGTTAHAVAKLNAEDGGNRRFILVSSTEATDDQPDKNLCRDVCAERVRRVLGGYTNAKGEAVPGLGGGFAYLKARRVAPHRLSTRLHHAEIWSALQLLHDLPLSHWDGQGLAVAAEARSAIAYLPDVVGGSEGVVRAWHEAHAERARTLYSWTPERVRAWAPGAQVSPIPESLRLRFGVRA